MFLDTGQNWSQTAWFLSTGGFVVLDGQTWKVKGCWEKGGDTLPFGYDFWYQYKFNILISTEFGCPQAWWKCFNPAEISTRK